MDSWDNYKLILAVHRAGTIRGAAELLNVNHATVSRRMVQIAEHYETAVFDKVTGGYRASELGLAIVEAAESIEQVTLAAERKSRAVSANLSGPIRVSMGEPIAQYLLQEELAQFVHNHPKINLSIETSINMADLDRSEADVVVRSAASPPDHLVGRRLFPFYLCEYCSKDYLSKMPYEERKWLRFSRSAVGKGWISGSTHPDAPTALTSDDLVWLLRAARAGEGMINTACYMADDDPDLMRLPGATVVEAQDLWVLTHPDLKDAPRIQHLMRHLADALEAKRDLIQGRR